MKRNLAYLSALPILLLFVMLMGAQNNPAPTDRAVTLRNNTQPALECVRVGTCEMREQNVVSTGRFEIDGLHNGSVSIRGWDGKDVRVRLRVDVDAVLGPKADSFDRVKTQIQPGRVTVDGPANRAFGWLNGTNWTVSAEVFVPHQTEIRIRTHNGSIHVSDIQGRVDVGSHNGSGHVERIQGALVSSTHNGSLSLSDITGDVTFETHNGSVHAEGLHAGASGHSNNGSLYLALDGDSTSPRRFDVETHNGKIEIRMPPNFDANVHAETHHGSVKSEMPTNPGGKLDEVRDFQINKGGGVSIRTKTHNGSVELKRL